MNIIKKVLSFISAAVMLLTVNGMTAYAENSDKVVDNADILTDSEEADLEDMILDIIEKHSRKYDIAVVTTYGTNGSIEAFADDYYDYNGYGYGSMNSGIILAIDMQERAYHMSTCGDGITVFTDYGLEHLDSGFVSFLSSGDYAAAFRSFADGSDELIDYYESNGEPYDNIYRKTYKRAHYGLYFMISLAAGLIIAATVCALMKSQLKSVNMQTQAASYIRQGSFRVTGSTDKFLYNTVTRTKVSSSSGSSGHRSGGSTTHSSSSGSSHGGHGGHF